jgi:DNA-binding beta-propeller fold protein YncE
MKSTLIKILSVTTLTITCSFWGASALATDSPNAARVEGLSNGPSFSVDPFWPKTLPNKWILGQVSGIATDKNDHIWIIHRPKTLATNELGASFNPPNSKCCIAAPPVIEFDKAGNLLRAWGGPGNGYDWPKNEHGIYVDQKGDVWIAGNDKQDRMLLKFTADGKFIMQIGSPGPVLSSNDTQNLGRPAHMAVDEMAHEVYVADGYGNRRVIVFDSNTGAYKRHWGAFGNKPEDAEFPKYNAQAPQFSNPVHCVRLLNDALIYVCDRSANRIQVFTKEGKFVRQIVVDPQTKGAPPPNPVGTGSVYDMVASEDKAEKYLYVADGTNNEVKIVLHETGEIVGTIGRSGRMAGEFHLVHNIAVDSSGNIYTAEVDTGQRIQKFIKVR